jgi:CelD/BcsL family acetyltransferase involved in cellulose biosynthesis
VSDPWAAVLACREDPEPFAAPWWSCAWWSCLGGAGDPRVVAVPGAGVVALWRDAAGVVRVMGGEDVTDYPGPVLAPGGAGAMAAGLLDALGPHGTAWSRLVVHNQRGREGFAPALAAEAARRGLPVRLTDDVEPVALLPLPATADAWVSGLGRHARHELARKRRRLARERPGAALRSATPASLDADLDAFVALHRTAPGEKGAFMTPAREAFFRRVAAEAAAAGVLRLDVLEDGGAPLAMMLGFRTLRAFLLYNAALDQAARALSPGIVLVAALVERAIGEGLEVFDFLRGGERYKLELGARLEPLQRVEVG